MTIPATVPKAEVVHETTCYLELCGVHKVACFTQKYFTQKCFTKKGGNVPRDAARGDLSNFLLRAGLSPALDEFNHGSSQTCLALQTSTDGVLLLSG